MKIFIKSMNNIYKLIGNELSVSLNSDWDKIILEIECSDKHVSASAKYVLNGNWKDNLDYDLSRDAMLAIIKLHNTAEENNFTPWNRAVYTLEKNGHFDMEFEWDQALQDEWEKS